MKSTTLPPLSEWTFESNDVLGLKDFADRLQTYLAVDHHFATGSLVVSLEAPFGSGKTAFLSMWRNSLTEQRKKSPHAPLPVLVNAWEGDFCGDPFASLIFSLTKAIELDESIASVESSDRLITAAKKATWFAVGIVNGIVSHTTGVDIVSADKFADERTMRPKTPDELFSLFELRKSSIDDLKECLRQTFGGPSVRAIIIIDELDRCRPDYAISYLEVIKHIFDISGIVFVLAIDKGQIAASARTMFGVDLNTNEYLRKFILRSFELPKPDIHMLRIFARSQAKRFMTLPEIRTTSFEYSHLEDRACELCSSLQLSLRQTEELFRMMGHVFSTQRKGVKPYFSWSLAVVLLCALKVKDNDVYRSVGHNSLDTRGFVTYLLTKMKDDDAAYWGTLYHTGKIGEKGGSESFEKIWSSLDGVKLNPLSSPKERESSFVNNWGGFRSNQIQKVYNLIETALTV